MTSPPLIQNLQSGSERDTIARVLYPIPERELTLTQLLEECDKTGGFREGTAIHEPSLMSAWETRLQACMHASDISKTPILGVCGTLNSGKSTVVASLLSAEQRNRVLIGERKEEATHRFVFWLPAAWQSNGLDRAIHDLIRGVTNCLPELLADDPAAAAAQYNARHDRMAEFNIPLVAYDAGLDSEGIGFLDCPDIQRSLDESTNEFTAAERLKRLKAIAPMCSAFFFVSSMQQLWAETTGQILQAVQASAAQAPLYVVLNMTQSNNANSYRTEVLNTMARWGVTDRVNGSFFAPFLKPEDSAVPVCPTFRSMDDGHSTLLDLRSQLVPAELQKSHLRSTITNLEGLLDAVSAGVTRLITTQSQTIHSIHEKVRFFLESKFISREGELRALCFNAAAKQLNESIQRTAPMAIRISQAPGNWVRGIFTKLKRRDATEEDAQQYAQIKNDDFSNAMLGHKCLPSDTSRESLTEIWEQAFSAIVNQPEPGFRNPEELDKLTREMWSKLPLGKKLELYRNVAISMAGFALVGALAPFDGGASLVIFTKYNLVLGGMEILAVAVGGPLAAALFTQQSAQELVKKLQNEVALPQVSGLFAGLMDGLGVPRYNDGAPILQGLNGQQIPLQVVETNPLQARINPLSAPLIQIDAQKFSELRTFCNPPQS
jgi:hypothetical protein